VRLGSPCPVIQLDLCGDLRERSPVLWGISLIILALGES